MANSIAYTKNYTAVLDEVYKRAACSTCLNSPRRMARAGRNAKEIMVPKIEVTGLGDYTRNVGYKTGSITYEFETKTFNYDRGIKLLADVMDVEEAGVLDCFVAAGSELQRTQVAPEADAFTFSEIAGHEGVTPETEDFADAEAEDVLASLRAATNAMDEAEVTTGSRILFITPTLKGVLDDFSLANPARSNRVLESRSRTRRAATACSSASPASWRCRRRASGPRSSSTPATRTSSGTRAPRGPTSSPRTPPWSRERPTTRRAASSTRPSRARHRAASRATTSSWARARRSTSWSWSARLSSSSTSTWRAACSARTSWRTWTAT